MKVIHTIAGLREFLAGRGRVGFVPTMGNLHEGHLKLARLARKQCDVLVSSVFVNRLQFVPSEEFDKYPRTLEADCQKLATEGVDVVFAPSELELYPEPQEFLVEPPAIASELCGHFRPGHFRGVCTVVMKLFNIVQPQVALFGKKDYQQLMLIRSMARQFGMPVEVVGVETVRADDGLALSSRNGYLSAPERQEAARLSRVLAGVRQSILDGRRDFATLCAEGGALLDAHGWRTEYIEVRRQFDLAVPGPEDRGLVVLAASWLGPARLIDNMEVFLGRAALHP